MSLISRGVLLCVFIIAVSASVTERLLKIPLFDVGGLWLNSLFRLRTQLTDSLVALIDIHSPAFYVALAITCFLGYHLFVLLFVPANRVRVLGDVGYLPDGKFTKKEIANSVKRRRVVGDIPPVFPNGWFALVESFRLKNGESANVTALGQQFAVFRDESGSAHIIDAYCPHMGANMAVGGRVIGDCLECPFHGWRFRGHDGKCTEIPYAEKVPEKAQVKSWPCLETNGWVHVWFHAEDAEPTWTPPELESITSGQWKYSGRSEHYINAHIEEIPENGADVAHLKQVHTPSIAAGIDLTAMWSKLFSFTWHTWTANWVQLPAPDEHVGSLRLTHDMKVFGYNFSWLNMSVHARQIGPGLVYLEFESFFGKGVFIQSLVPVEPMVQKLVHNLYIHWAVPNCIAKFFLVGEAIQVERDIMIWNNKRYQNKALFVKSAEDSLIARHRRWYSQFYSENSPRLNFQKESLDW